jgi:O-antigen/teichoic acid export membrane protein
VLTHSIRRGGWTLADQIVSSGTNFLLLILVARRMPPADFGAFALLYGYYVVCIQIAQTAFADPVLVRFPRNVDSARRALRGSSGAAAVFGVLCSCALLPLSGPILGGISVPVLILAMFLPALLVQNTLRMGFVASGQPRKAMVSDAAWGLFQCIAIFGVLSVTTKLSWVFLAWGIGGLLAAGIAIAQAGVLPRVASALDWLREYGDLARPYLVEGVVLTICTYATLLLVGKIAGLAAVGAFRAADTLFGPATVVIGAGRSIAITELSRLLADRPHRIGRGAIMVTLGFGAVGGVSGLVAMSLPTSVGAWFFGGAWQLMTPLIPAQTVYRMAQGAVLGPAGALRAVQAVGALLVFRVTTAVALLTAAAAGAAFAGAEGAAMGLAGMMTLSCLYAAALYARYRPRMSAGPLGRQHMPTIYAEQTRSGS